MFEALPVVASQPTLWPANSSEPAPGKRLADGSLWSALGTALAVGRWRRTLETFRGLLEHIGQAVRGRYTPNNGSASALTVALGRAQSMRPVPETDIGKHRDFEKSHARASA